MPFLCYIRLIPSHFHAGMHAWFAAAADTRYSVVVPIIGVQVVNPNDDTLDLVLVYSFLERRKGGQLTPDIL